MNNTCPCCDRHCHKDDLHCHRGRKYFGLEEKNQEQRPEHPQSQEQPKNEEEKIILLLRKCGHFLHHNVGQGGDTAVLLQGLSPEEKTTLSTLLEKCSNNWQNASKAENEK